MFAANRYVIRRATDADHAALQRIADLDSARPLAGDILVGELAGDPAAAISLTSGQVVADPFRPTANLAAHLRVRANGIAAAQREPVLRKRIRAALRIATV